MKNKVNIGLIGVGEIGKLHAEHLVHRVCGANLVSIAERKEKIDATKDFAESLEIPTITDDYREILNDKKIEAVAICSSTDTHAQIVIEAAKAGKHIFCEKPIDHDINKANKAFEEVAKAGVKFQVGFNRRFDPNFAQVKQNILANKIGEPHLIHIISRDPEPPSLDYIKISGGIFMDQTIHDFDMIRFLIDSEVEELFTYGEVKIDPNIGLAGDIDTLLIVLKFKNGVIGTIDNSRKSVYGYDQRVEVFGSAGSIITENQTPYRTIISNIEGIHAPKPLYFFLERYKESYIIEMQAFINAILTNKPVPVSGIDGKMPMLMALAAKKSLEEKRIVKLSEIEEI